LQTPPLIRDDVVDLLHRTETYVFVTIEGHSEVRDENRGALTAQPLGVSSH